MKLIRRDPDKGYLDCLLWVPKSLINVTATQSALSFLFTDSYTGEQRVLSLWKESTHHLLVPRAFWEVGSLPCEVVDCRPMAYPEIDFKSRIKLDHRASKRGLIPTGNSVQQLSIQAMSCAMGGILQLACGKGKGQPLLETVMTPTGPTRIGSLKVGDLILGSDGRPTKVLGVFPQGRRPTFKIKFSDETHAFCDDQHLWRVKYDRRKWRVVSTQDLLDQELRSAAGWKFAVPYCAPVQFESEPLLIDPWLLGAWLGDGGLSPHLVFTNPEEDLLERFMNCLPKGDTAVVQRPTNRCVNIRVHAGTFSAELTELGLKGCRSWEKFIPQTYLLANVESRWELLRGLLDTDGSIANQGRAIEFSTTSPQLARDMKFLVRSLGGRISTIERETSYTYRGKKLKGRLSFRQRITFPAGGATPVSSVKHLIKWDPTPGQRRFKYVTAVEPAGEQETVCIKVDAEDECYLTRHFTVTHNTVVALEKIARGRMPALVLVDNTNLLEQWLDDVNEFLIVPGGVGVIGAGRFEWKKGLVLATYQTLASKADELPEEVRRWFGQIFWDEAHHVNAPTFSKTADLFYGQRYALTATPRRDDGLHIICDFHIGRVLHRDLKQPMKARFIFKWTGLELDILNPSVAQAVLDVNGEVHTSKVPGYLGQWRQRLWMIMQDCIDALEIGRKVLVLSNSVDEVINLMTLWTRGPHAPLYTDIPKPTVQDIGETLDPLFLQPKDMKKLRKDIETLWKLYNAGQPVNEAHVHKLMMKWNHAAVGRKLENETMRRERAFLKELIEEPSTSGVMSYGVPAKIRQRFLQERQVVFAITKYGKEGLDCIALDTVLVSTLFSGKNGLQQLMGRPTRLSPGKKKPMVVFYVDNIGLSHGMSQKLQKHMRDWPHEEGGPFEFELLDYPKVSTCKASTLKQAFGQ
jgi:hypothetical protein